MAGPFDLLVSDFGCRGDGVRRRLLPKAQNITI